MRLPLPPRETILKIATLAVFGFLGGMVPGYVFLPKDSRASSGMSAQSYEMLHDGLNRKGLESYVYNGYPAQNFYAKDGGIRLQHGIYSNPGEEGLPLTGFSDNAGHLRMLFRLAGANESPVIIMKDRGGRDRIVFGLDLSGGNEEPFMAVFDSAGRKTMIFGSY